MRKTNTSNRRIEKIVRRRKIADKIGGCDICPPHSGENTRRHPKHGVKKKEKVWKK